MDEARMCLFADVDDPRVSFPFGPLQLPSGAKKVLPSRPTSKSAVVLPEAEASRDERKRSAIASLPMWMRTISRT